jgi:hypothetical protein
VWSSASSEHMLWCHGRFSSFGEEFCMAKVYAPCNPGEKQGLWDSLFNTDSITGLGRGCVCGDSNAVKVLAL